MRHDSYFLCASQCADVSVCVGDSMEGISSCSIWLIAESDEC